MVTRRQQIVLTELRRERVQQLVSRGYNQREISKELGVSLGLVNNDVRWIRRKARTNLEHYINITLPEEMDNSLIRLRDLIREAWKDIDDPNTSRRDKHNAIQLVKDCTALRLEILGSGVLANQLNKQQQQLEQQPPAAEEQGQQDNNEATSISRENTAA